MTQLIFVSECLHRMEDSISNRSSALPKSSKLKKFVFNDGYVLLLLQSVRLFDSHRAQHGEKDKAFEKVLERFIEQVPSPVWRFREKPTVKTLRDKLRVLMSARKRQNVKTKDFLVSPKR